MHVAGVGTPAGVTCSETHCRSALATVITTCGGTPGEPNARKRWFAKPAACRVCRATIRRIEAWGHCSEVTADQADNTVSAVVAAVAGVARVGAEPNARLERADVELAAAEIQMTASV